MKKNIILSLLLLCSMLGIAQNRISVSPAQPLDKAVSGHYAAWTNDGLATYGGCNFPDVPCADGGQKVYYPRAYGASIQVPGGAVYLGGMDSTSSISECLFIDDRQVNVDGAIRSGINAVRFAGDFGPVKDLLQRGI